MPIDIAAYQALVMGRPWVLGVNNQVVSYCGQALCDPLLQTSVSALEPFRYATCLFAWSLVATHIPGGPPEQDNIDGDDIEIPTQQQRTLFQVGINASGVGEIIPGGWWPMTISDTDAFRGGAPGIDRGFMFLVTGVTTNALDVFQRGGTGASPDDPKMYSNWLQQSHNGPGYGFEIQRFHINYTAMQFSFGDTGCSYRLGVAGFWPTWGDPYGAQTVRNGCIATPGMYLPFTTSVCIGARDDVRQLALVLTTGQSGRVQCNSAQPSIAGSREATDHTINQLNDGTVYCPFRVVIVGYIVCVPDAAMCGMPMLTPEQVRLVQARLTGVNGALPLGGDVLSGARPYGTMVPSSGFGGNGGGIPTPP